METSLEGPPGLMVTGALGTGCMPWPSRVEKTGYRRSTRSQPTRWADEENERLARAVKAVGPRTDWIAVSAIVQTRDPQECRQHWCRVLNPAIRKGPFSRAEIEKLQSLVSWHGMAWSVIAEEMPGRTATQCQARWLRMQRKARKIRNRGLGLRVRPSRAAPAAAAAAGEPLRLRGPATYLTGGPARPIGSGHMAR